MRPADLVLFSTTIFDSVSDIPFDGGIAVIGDTIVFVGSREIARRYVGPGTRVLDFGDKLILPGFCDGHAHLEGTADSLFPDHVTGMDTLPSEAACAEVVRAYVDAHPEKATIYGTNWSYAAWGEGAPLPSRHSLDAVVPDKPVFLLSDTGHDGWMNSAAIAYYDLESIVAMYPHLPVHEYAHRDESGHFTGYVAERICSHVRSLAEQYTPAEQCSFEEQLIHYLNSFGITGFTEATARLGSQLADFFQHIKAMENRGKLTVRFHIWPGLVPRGDCDPTEEVRKIKPYEAFFNTDTLHIAGIKTLADGIPANHTALMLEPYADMPDFCGKKICSDDFPEWIVNVNAMGYPIKIHCTGDGAVRYALDCYERSAKANGGNLDLRNSIEHMDDVSDADLPRYAQLGVIASIQPAHIVMAKYPCKWKREELTRYEYRWRDLAESGAILSVGTDSPVVSLNPYENIYKAVTRRDLDGVLCAPNSGNQALTLPQVLKAYTWGSAYSNHMEHKVGTLEAGKYADIAVASHNLFAIPSEELKDCFTVCTIFNGKIVYTAPEI